MFQPFDASGLAGELCGLCLEFRSLHTKPHRLLLQKLILFNNIQGQLFHFL
ncbi:MAG TPA: hypothetical protein VK518_00640 [Puia sp.]|nr:hypothetical protein [Puia sp.]